MKTITYPLRLDLELYKRIETLAKERHKKISELLRDFISEALPPEDTSAAIAQHWEKLGPAPTIDYDKI